MIFVFHLYFSSCCFIHDTGEQELLFDPEIERACRANRRVTRERRQAALNTMGDRDEAPRRRTMGEYGTPTVDRCSASIVRPPIQANNFEIKPALRLYYNWFNKDSLGEVPWRIQILISPTFFKFVILSR